jgi:hypothetical protein
MQNISESTIKDEQYAHYSISELIDLLANSTNELVDISEKGPDNKERIFEVRDKLEKLQAAIFLKQESL